MLADGDALVYLAMLKKFFTRFVWCHPFSSYVSYNLFFNQNFNLLTRMFTICGFITSTHAINLTICAFSLSNYVFNLATRVFSVLSCGFELVPCRVELVTPVLLFHVQYKPFRFNLTVEHIPLYKFRL